MKRNFIITIAISFIITIFLINNISALTLKLTPSTLYLNGESGKKICEKLTIEYSVVNGLVEARDLWAEKNLNTKDLHAHNLSAEEVGIEFEYPKSLKINNQEIVDVCVKAETGGLYHGALFYKTITTTGNTGIELNVWVVVNITKETQDIEIQTNTNNESSEKIVSSRSSSHSKSLTNQDNLLISTNEEINNSIKNENTVLRITGNAVNLKKDGSITNIFIVTTISLLMVFTLLMLLNIKKKNRGKR